MFLLCQVGFESLCQLAPRQQDAPPAASTFQPNVRAKTRHGPFVGAARMLFAQAKVIVEPEVG